MSAFDDILADTADAMIATFGESVTYNGTTITAIVDRSSGTNSEFSKDTRRYDDAEMLETDWCLKVRVADVATPKANDKVVIGSTSYFARPIGTSGGLHTMTITRFDRVVIGPKSRASR